jgi:hypothetical protein
VTLQKFTFMDGTWANASVDAAQAAAYSNFQGPTGVLNQSACEWGAPIYLSQPM